jgi:hypothetical protein
MTQWVTGCPAFAGHDVSGIGQFGGRKFGASLIVVVAGGHEVAADQRRRDSRKGARAFGAKQHLQGKHLEACGALAAAGGVREPRANLGLLSVIACGNYPPAEPGALMCEPLKAAVGVAGATWLPEATLHWGHAAH